MTCFLPARRGPTGRTVSSCRAPCPAESSGSRYEVLSEVGPFVAALADFLFLDQAQVPADVQAEVAREEPRDPLDVQRAVREIRSGVRGALDDPDLARSAICVVEAPAVVDRRDVIRAAMDEEERPRLK